MKVRDVMMMAMSGQIKWFEAADILGISDRQIRRWKCKMQTFGIESLFDKRRNQPSPRRIPLEIAEKVLALYRDEYAGFNVQHFYEELKRRHVEIEVSYTWIKTLLQAAKLVPSFKKRGTYRRRRERRPISGMLLHIDGSEHRWFEHPTNERQSLIAILDDADSKILAAWFFPEEGTKEVLTVIKSVVKKYGTFVSLYSDRASHFAYTPEAGGPIDKGTKTQVEQVLDELGIELIRAYSPQARGRGERLWQTMQGRLPLELKKENITSYEGANRYLNKVYVPKHNKRFSVEQREAGTAFMPLVGFNLDRVFSLRHERVVDRDNTISFNNRVLQLPKISNVATLAKRKVEIRELLDGTIEVLRGKQLIASFPKEPVVNLRLMGG